MHNENRPETVFFSIGMCIFYIIIHLIGGVEYVNKVGEYSLFSQVIQLCIHASLCDDIAVA